MERYMKEDDVIKAFVNAAKHTNNTGDQIAFRMIIAEIPSADVRENVRGEWLPHPNKQYKEWDICSACGTGCKRREFGIHANGDKWVTEYNFPYCPNCGADMRKPKLQYGDEDTLQGGLMSAT